MIRYAYIISLFFLQSVFFFSVVNIDVLTIWDESLRISNNLYPYKDYDSHNGFIASFLFSPLLRFLSIEVSMFISAILINTLCAILIYKIVKFVTSSEFYSLSAYTLSILWFLNHIGGIYYDHLAILVSVYLIYFYLKYNHKILLSIFIFGTLPVICFFFKSTVGAMSIIAVMTSITLHDRKFMNLSNFIKIVVLNLSFLLLFIYIIYFYFDLNLFLNNYFYQSLEYGKVSNDKSFINILINILMPYQINAIDAFKNRNYGLILFIPIIITIYIGYIVYFKSLRLENKNFKIVIFYSILIFILCSPIVGRDIKHLFFTNSLLIILILYFLFKKKYFFFKLILIFYLSSLSFIFLINDHYRNIEKKEFIEAIKNEYGNYIDKISIDKNITNIAFYDSYLRFYYLNRKLLPFNRNLSYDYELTIPVKSSIYSSLWQDRQISNLKNYKVELIITFDKNSKYRSLNHNEYIINNTDFIELNDFLLSNYYQIKHKDMLLLVGKNK